MARLNVLSLAAATILAPALVIATPAFSQSQFVEDIGASERINFSGKLRMLSQRIPAAACYSNAGIKTDQSTALLEAAAAEFDLIVNGLEFGEDSLGIKGAESDRAVLGDISQVNEVWGPLQDVLDNVIANGTTDDDVRHLANESAPLLENAKSLVSTLVAEYADPAALLQADAITIDIAGRQRMLAQRISKNVCLALNGVNSESAMKELTGAREMYQASVDALRYGLPSAGIDAPTDEEIIAGLDEVLKTWNSVQPTLDTVLAGDQIDDAAKGEVFTAMNSLTGQMNTLVGVYNDLSKLGL